MKEIWQREMGYFIRRFALTFALSEEDETDESGGSLKGAKLLLQLLFSGREIPCLIEHVGV